MTRLGSVVVRLELEVASSSRLAVVDGIVMVVVVACLVQGLANAAEVYQGRLPWKDRASKGMRSGVVGVVAAAVAAVVDVDDDDGGSNHLEGASDDDGRHGGSRILPPAASHH